MLLGKRGVGGGAELQDVHPESGCLFGMCNLGYVADRGDTDFLAIDQCPVRNWKIEV